MVRLSRQTTATTEEPAPMHSSRSAASRQCRIQCHAGVSDAIRFFNVLTVPEVFDVLESSVPAYRERRYPPPETLSMFMAQALKPDRSCQGIVNDAAVQRLRQGLPPGSTKTGGYCRARQRLPLSMLSSLVLGTGRLVAGNAPAKWHWHNRRVRLVDGTTVTLPDTPANQLAYPQQGNQEPGLGFPICRIVGITCMFSGAVLNAAVGKYKGKETGELALLRPMLDSLEATDVLVADALYATYFMLADLASRKVDAVFEQHGARKRSTDFRKGKKLGQRDHLIVLSKPKVRPEWMTAEQYLSAPDTLMVRELAAGGKVLVTTLLCPKEFPKIALKDLFKRRWNVELDIRNIKTTLGMETLSCKTPEMAEKEVFAYFLAYNLIRLIMLQSALLADVLPRSLSFKHTQQLWLAWSQSSSGGNLSYVDDDDDAIRLLMLVAERTVGKRPGRTEPRALKRRSKAYPLLTQARATAREKVRKHGHPKKLK